MTIESVHYGIIKSNLRVELIMKRLDRNQILLVGKWNSKPLFVPSGTLGTIVNTLGRICEGVG